MRTITLDFETHYAKDYSLTSMTNEEYVRDERFQALCLGVKEFGKEAYCIAGPDKILQFLSEEYFSSTAVIMHHAQFDGFILSERYGVRPAFIFDTLSMARAMNGPLARASLEQLALRYGLSPKTVPYNRFRGRRWEDMDETLQADLCSGAAHDVELTERIFRELVKDFPKDELEIIDATVRMYTEPRILGNAELFTRLAEEEFLRKNALLEELGVTPSHLQSSATLLRLLEDCGEEVPRKLGSSGSIPQFAANDDYMLDNQHREDRVGKLIRARLEVKSTINETRAARLAALSRRGPLPIYHKYWTAVTGRWGGGEKTNIQNLPKDIGKDPKDRIRSGLTAPPGELFCVLDFSKIEYNILVNLAGQQDKIDSIRKGVDLYCGTGSRIFGRTITKADKKERDYSKKVVLGCGYGTGKDKAAQVATAEGFDLPRTITDRAVDVYREEHHKVVEFWARCDKIIPLIATGGEGHLVGTPLKFGGGSLILPNGTRCAFDLVWCQEVKSWFRRVGRGGQVKESDPVGTFFANGYTKYWGGGLTEFCCQSLARIRLAELILKIKRELGLLPVFLVHDEYVTTVPEEEAQFALAAMIEMAREPSLWWLPGPFYDAEGAVPSPVYGK